MASTTADMGAMFIEDDSTLLPLSPGILMQPAVAEYLRRLALLPQVLARVVRLYARDPLRNLWPAAIGTLAKLLPTALFDNRPPERYLRALFGSSGHSDDFRQLRSRYTWWQPI